MVVEDCAFRFSAAQGHKIDASCRSVCSIIRRADDTFPLLFDDGLYVAWVGHVSDGDLRVAKTR